MGNCLKEEKEGNKTEAQPIPERPAKPKPAPKDATLQLDENNNHVRFVSINSKPATAAPKDATLQVDEANSKPAAAAVAAPEQPPEKVQEPCAHSPAVLAVAAAAQAGAPLEGGPLFAVSLHQSAKRSDPKGLVPYPIRHCCAFLLDHLGTEGIFRMPGSTRAVQNLISKWDADPLHQLCPDELVENACSVIVQFLMRLKEEPEQVTDCIDASDRETQDTTCFPGADQYTTAQHLAATKLQARARGKWARKKLACAKLYGATMTSANLFCKAVRKASKDYSESPAGGVSRVRELLLELPAENQATFKVICGMLHTACREEHATTNKMDPSKLGLCLTPGIQWGLSVMIRDYETVFDGVAS